MQMNLLCIAYRLLLLLGEVVPGNTYTESLRYDLSVHTASCVCVFLCVTCFSVFFFAMGFA